MKTIFVGIAAYNEPDLEQTIQSCLDNAKFSDRVFFGVSSLNNDGNEPNLNRFKNLKHIQMNYETLFGTSINRLTASLLNNKEDYYLQVDGHMLFEKDWDIRLIDHYEEIKESYDKPIITNYVPTRSRAEDGSINFYKNVNDLSCGKIIPMNNLLDESQSACLMLSGVGQNWLELNYTEHYLISAHFIFSEMKFIEDIMPDPLLTMVGEETIPAIRAYTRGYRMFAIKPGIVWHKNKWHGVKYEFDRYFDIRNTGEFFEHFDRRQLWAAVRTMEISLGKITGFWGATSIDALKDYEIKSGIDYIKFYDNMRLFIADNPEDQRLERSRNMFKIYDEKYGEK